MPRIAVIGAGLAGLTVARDLAALHDVTVFEKSRGTGGRMATRYAGGFEFDHGAQFFTARSSAFRAFLQPLIDDGVVSNWPAQFAELDRGRIVNTRQWDDEYPHYVGTPRMNAVGKWLAKDLDIRLQTRIVRLAHGDQGWTLIGSDEAPLGPYDWVISAVPAPQMSALMPATSSLAALADSVKMQACMALMLGFDEPPPLPWQAALVRGADISWVSANSSKPGRSDAVCLVVHSTNAWADAHVDDDVDSVQRHLLTECRAVIGSHVDQASFRGLQRWRYANIEAQPASDGCHVDSKLQLAACGDWFVRGRVEAAFKSGRALAQRLQARL